MTHHHRQLTAGVATLDDACRWLDSADAILMAAGAGLSAAAGYDYTDTNRFAQLFPALHAAGFRARYQLIGARLPPTHLWGFWAIHTSDIRFDPHPNALYTRLRDLIGERDHFVMTSNVDALFARNGFDPTQVYTPQGDYGLYQCRTPCTRQVWNSQPVIDRALHSYDPDSGAIAPDDVPRCPNCAGPTLLNVNLGSNYINDHFRPGLDALDTWLTTHKQRNLVIFEIGAGFNTPGVIRYPDEAITKALPNTRLIRINPNASEVPATIAGRSASIPLVADRALDEIALRR